MVNRAIRMLLAVLFFVPSIAWSKVVFLDLNFGPEEVEVARAQAKARGEEFVVIPDLSNVPKAEYDHLVTIKKEYSKIRAQVTAQVERTGGAATPKRMTDIEKEFQKYYIKAEKIADLLKEKGGGTTTVVVSGHSDGTRFDGVLGAVSQADLLEDFETSGMKNSLRSVYLWGCYSGSSGPMEAWNSVLPTAEYLIGYSTKSDLSEVDDGPGKLKRAMEAEYEARKNGDRQNALRCLEKVNGADKRHALAGFVGSNYVCVKRKFSGPMSELKRKCPDILSGLYAELQILYSPYADGIKAVPQDRDDTDLRKYYQKVQEGSHCLVQCSEEAKKDYKKFFNDIGISPNDYGAYDFIPCPTAVIGLIKFEHVVSNYKRRYKAEFEFWKKILADEPGVTSDLRKILTGDFSPTDRKLMATLVNRGTMQKSEFKNWDARDLAEKVVERAWGLLNDVRVPLSWIDEQPNPEKPSPGYMLTDEYLLPITELPKKTEPASK